MLRHGRNSTAYQILNPGLSLWFCSEPEGVVGYVDAAGRRIVAGEPVTAPESIERVAAAFEVRAHEVHRPVCYFGAEAPLADGLEVDRLLLGAQPVWDPARWPDILRGKSSLRAQLARARNKGVSVERWSAERATTHPELASCLEEWLDTRGLPPMHFLVEPDTLTRLFDRLVFVALRGEKALAFLVASPAPRRQGWLVEQIVRGHGAPNGTSELLLDAAFRHLAESGCHAVTLGLSPLSRRAPLRESPKRWWVRFLLGWVRAHGRRFYDFDGLDFFKAKLEPEHWEPIWALTRGRALGVRDLYAIATAFSGGFLPFFLLRGLGRALRSELRMLRRLVRRRERT